MVQVKEWVMTGPGSLDQETLVIPQLPPVHPGIIYLHQEDGREAQRLRLCFLFMWHLYMQNVPHLFYLF